MELSEQDYAEAFGVDLEAAPAETSETDGTERSPAAAEEAAQTSEETGGETEQGGEETAQESGAEPAEREAQPTQEPQRAEMDAQERHRQAAMRREREQRAAEEATQQRVDKLIEEIFRNRTDPFTGKAIRTEADWRAYEREMQRREHSEELERAGLSEETLRAAVQQEIAPMRREMLESRLAAMREQAKAANARAEQEIARALETIGATDPSIRTLNDIARMPTAARFNELVQKGVGLEDAFFLANRKAIEEKRAKAAYAKGAQAAADRNHLNPIGAAEGTPQMPVPQEFAENYRTFMPEATAKEIRAAYEEERKLRK